MYRVVNEKKKKYWLKE